MEIREKFPAEVQKEFPVKHPGKLAVGGTFRRFLLELLMNFPVKFLKVFMVLKLFQLDLLDEFTKDLCDGAPTAQVLTEELLEDFKVELPEEFPVKLLKEFTVKLLEKLE